MYLKDELGYLYALTRFGIKPGLEVMERMMEILGHPERKFKSIHVTGTNGKGSTCAMLESVIREAGYKTALYTSPHLYTFNERIQINRVSISDVELAGLVWEIRKACEREHIEATFFEFTTALAFLYFARSNIDIAVIEVGMGGRYDATNVITPLVSVITNIGLDHTEFFGPTLAHVACEKAGIIKEGVPVVIREEGVAMLRIFGEEAREKNANIVLVQDMVKARVISSDLGGQEIDVVDGERSYRVQLPLIGKHQVKNMATAIAALTTLFPLQPTPRLRPAGTLAPAYWSGRLSPSGERGTRLRDAIPSGIAKTNWEGRLQVISKAPLIIVDGAHNGDGALALVEFLKNLKRFDVLVFAAKKNKDISDMLSRVIPLFSHIIVTEGSFAAEDTDVLAGKIRGIGKRVVVYKNVASAIDAGRRLLDRDSTMLIAGSLYMVSDALGYFRKKGV